MSTQKSFHCEQASPAKMEFAVSRHQPYGITKEYIKSIKEANLYQLAHLIKLVGIPLQVKVYLFWRKY